MGLPPRFMRYPLAALFVLPAFLVACSPSEESITQKLFEANRCATAADCTLIGSECPFGCNIYVYKDEVDRMKSLIDGFASNCMYKCPASLDVECRQGKCMPVLDLPEEGTAGQACVSHEECATPMAYLLRSNCPYNSRCVDNVCRVVCPMPSARVEKGWGKQECNADTDCDCSAYTSAGATQCRCIDNSCVAVVEEEN